MDEKGLSGHGYEAVVVGKSWLSDRTFELAVTRPGGFDFLPGQKVEVRIAGLTREYTIVSAPQDKHLAFCIRHLTEGKTSSLLAAAQPGEIIGFSAAYGFFLHRPGKSVFVATGTGVAPFAAFARSGVRGYTLLHGVAAATELYYRHLLEKAAGRYVGCISEIDQAAAAEEGFYAGRVTEYLKEELAPGRYTFYLCGNGEMVGDAMKIIDSRFERSRIFTESFFSNAGH